MFNTINLADQRTQEESDNTKEEEKNDTTKVEIDLPYYGELKVIQKAELQYTQGTGENQTKKMTDIVIVQDEVTGCMYFSNDTITKESLTPLYDETGKVKGCGELIE